MRTARPATRPALAVGQVFLRLRDPLGAGLEFLRFLDPAYPFVPRERRNVFPRSQHRGAGGQGLAEVGGDGVDDAV